MFKKSIAFLLAMAVLVMALPMSTFVFASAAELPAEVAGLKFEIGASIIDEDFESATAIPSGFELRNPTWDGWPGGAGSMSLSTYNVNGVNDKGLQLNTTADDVILLPTLNTTNYVYEAEITLTNNAAGSFGLLNDMSTLVRAANADSQGNNGDYGANRMVIYAPGHSTSGTKVYWHTKFSGAAGQQNLDKPSALAGKPAIGETLNFKVYSWNGYNYFYINNIHIATFANVKNFGPENVVGLFASSSSIFVSKVSVNALTEKTSTNDNIIGSNGNKVMTKGDSLMAYDFTTSTVADGSLPAGFTYGGAKTNPAIDWGWGGSNASVSANMTTYKGTKYLQLNAVSCDALIAAPEVNTRDYVYEITFIPMVSNAYVGISNQTWGTDTLSSSQWFAVQDTNAPYHKYKGTDNSGGTGEFTTSDSFRSTLGQEVTLKVVSYDGINYYFINDRYVTGCQYMSTLGTNETTDRPGLYTYGGNIYIKSMYVNEVEVKEKTPVTPEITVPDELKNFDVSVGDSVLDVDFTKAELESGLPEGWYALLGGAGNNAQVGWGNAGGYGAKVESKNGSNMLHFTSWNCDSYLLSPKLEVSDYVYEAVIVPSGTGYTGLANNAYGTDNTDIKDIQWFCFDDAEAIYWKSYNSGIQDSLKLDAAAPNNIKYTAGTEYKLSIYSFNGKNYYYINDTFIFSANQSNPNTDKDFDRVGFYGYPGDFFIKSLNVNKLEVENSLPDGIGKIGDEYYFIGDVIYENNFDNETVGALPDGWSYGWPHGTDDHKTTFGWAANAQSTASAQVVNHATHGKVVQFGSTNTDAFMALPATGTMNYVYEATVVVNTNGNSIGHANNFYGTTYEGNGVMYNTIYPNNTKDKAKFAYRGSGTGAEWTTNFSPANGEELKLKIVSLNGNNYIFYNGVHVATAPWRGGAGESDNPGFYTYNGNMYVKDVKVSSVGTAVLDFDAARVDVDEDKNVNLELDFSFDKSQASYDKYVDGDYVAEGAEDFVLGFLSYVGDEDISKTLTTATENVEVNVISDAEITQNEAMLYAYVSEKVPAADMRKWINVRPFVKADGIYFYGDGVAYTVANLANGAYASANTQAQKDLISEVFGNYDEFFVGPGAKELTFTVFADFHYKAGMYSVSIDDLNSIFKRAEDTNSAFVLSAGDMTNDMKGSPELVNAFLGYKTADGNILNAYNVYGNHELESSGNTMQIVTPTLTNDVNAHWGDGTVGHDPANMNYGYYYVDVDGFRIICVDNSNGYNPNHYKNPDGTMGEVVGWEHYLPGSYGDTSAASNAARGFYEGANAVANTKGGSLGDVQMAWLEEVLMDAAAKDLHCIINGHAGYSGLGFGGGSSDADQVRALYKKANDANPGTVLMSINGHIHTNHQGWNEGVFYFDVNTVRNNWWQGTAVPNHYGPEHTYLYQEYDAQGNPVGAPVEKSLNTLGMAANTWFSEDPLSAVVTINDAGVVSIDGSESRWAYGIDPPSAVNPGTECRISSGLFWNCDLYGHVEEYVSDDVATFALRSTGTHTVKCAAAGCDYASAPEAHSFDQSVEAPDYVAGAQDCDNAATYYKSCVCGAKGTETFTSGSAAGHKPSTDWTKDNAGHWHACANCTDKLEYAAHTYDQKVEKDEYSAGVADCTQPAKFYYSCVCGAKGTNTFDSGSSMGHDKDDKWTSDANGHWHECANCTDKLDYAAHTYDQTVATDAYKASNADCNNAATYYKSCVCGAKGTETFASGTANGHTPKAEWDWDSAEHYKICQECENIIDDTVGAHDNQGATCSDFGACTICGRTDYVYAPDVHDLKDVAESEASHDKDGNIAHKQCKDCNKLFDDAGNELDPEDVIVDGGDHDYGEEYKSDKDGHWQECACGGKTDKVDHTFGEWEVTSEATEATPGTKVRKCSVCGFEEEGFIPATGDESPETGDTFNPFIWIAALLLSGSIFSFAVSYRRKRRA